MNFFIIKLTKSLLLASFILISTISYSQTDDHFDKMEWFKDAKFGMFIHWGLYSKTAGYWNGKIAKGYEHFMLYERIPYKEYAKIANDFNPVNFNADKWVLAAKNAGMKYFIITTKHHDGFAMYDSPSSDYNIVKQTPYGKDPMKKLAKACHKHGIKLGFYYSLGRDWQDPDVPTNWPVKAGRSNTWDYPNEDAKVFNNYFERKVKPQVRELLTQYGEVAVMWFDTPELISKNESEELRKLILGLQPNCIINARIGNGFGDYRVTEQELSNDIYSKPWEACITMSKNWGYIAYDTIYKSPELLAHVILETISKGGNLLLNNGPTANGEMTEEALKRLTIIGKWMKKNSEGIYGARTWRVANELLSYNKSEKTNETDDNSATTMKDAIHDKITREIVPEIRFTSKGNDLFAYVCSWKGKEVLIKSINMEKDGTIKNVTLLGSSKKVVWKQTIDGLLVTMPSYPVKEIPVIGFKISF